MDTCSACGGTMERGEFEHCGPLEYCPGCDAIRYVRSKVYLNGKEVEYCVEVNTRTKMSRILSSEEEPANKRT